MAHLFITAWQEVGSSRTIDDPSFVHQIIHVLRMRVQDIFFLQDLAGTRRYKVSIVQITKEKISINILEKTIHTDRSASVGMVLAMPNKFEKLELIIQKLAEIGIDHIICRPSRRSVLRDLPPKKHLRLQHIAREATEQSRGWKVPEIVFSPTFPVLESEECILFDYHEDLTHALPSFTIHTYISPHSKKAFWGIIGPEGGFAPEEISTWLTNIDAQCSLGDQVLRMETAAIVGGWRLRQWCV